MAKSERKKTGKSKSEGNRARQPTSTTSLGKRRSRSRSPGQQQNRPPASKQSNISTMSNPKSAEYGSQASPLRVPAAPKELIKVTIVGAAGGIGQPLALLLMMHSEYVHHLALFDLVDSTPGVGLDVSHIDRQVKVTTHVGPDNLAEAVRGASVILVLAGLAQKPGMSRDDLFGSNAKIVYNIAKCCAQTAPEAMLCIVTNPVNSLVPLACEVYARHHVSKAKCQKGQDQQSQAKSSNDPQHHPQQQQQQQQPSKSPQQQQQQQQKQPPSQMSDRPIAPVQQQQAPPKPESPGKQQELTPATAGAVAAAAAAASAAAAGKTIDGLKTVKSNQSIPLAASAAPPPAQQHSQAGHFDDCCRRIFGVTTLDVVRASTLTAKSAFYKSEPNGLFKDPGKIQVPVVGGHAGKTIMPILSQATPKLDKKRLLEEKATTSTLIDSIQQAGIEVLNAKRGKGSATLAMAYAACRFTVSLLRAMGGESNIVECAFVRHATPCCNDLEYFAAPLLLGKDGYVKMMANYLPCGASGNAPGSLLSAGASPPTQGSGTAAPPGVGSSIATPMASAAGPGSSLGTASSPSRAQQSTIPGGGESKLLPFELQMLEDGSRELRLSIVKGEDFAKEHLSAEK